MRTRRFAIVVAVLVASLAVVVPALAQGLAFGLRPEDQTKGYFEFTLSPGEAIDDAVFAVNNTSQGLRLAVTRVDGHTALTGGITFPGTAEGPARWLDLPDEGAVEIPAGSAIRLPFKLTVPEGTPPGEYVAGFLAALEDPAALGGTGDVGGGFKINVIQQMALSVIITVLRPDLCRLEVSEVRPSSDKGQWKVELVMSNTGNTHFKGTGEFFLRPASGGEPTLARPFNIDYFIAGDTIHYPLYFDTVPAAGDYTSEVSINGTDCSFQSAYTQPVSISATTIEESTAEARRWEQAQQENQVALPQTGSPDWLQALGIFMLCLAGLTVGGVLLVFVLMRRKRPSRRE